MARIEKPRPVVYEVKVRTPLTDAYMRCLHVCFTDPKDELGEFTQSGPGWFRPNHRDRGVERIEVAEAEFGRGIVFTVRGDERRVTQVVEFMLAEAEARFNEWERGLKAKEDEVAAAAAVDDAHEGF